MRKIIQKLKDFWEDGPKLNSHEYLMKEDYYESNSVGTKARSSYGCEHCGLIIKQGIPHTVHKFYPDFQGYRTHHKCSDHFIESLRTPDDGESDY